MTPASSFMGNDPVCNSCLVKTLTTQAWQGDTGQRRLVYLDDLNMPQKR